MGAMALCGALCYGELSARYPEAGGGYVYLREAYGPAVAFMYGWMAFLVMDPGLTAALAVGLATYAGYVLKLSPAGIKMLAIATIIVVALINIRGVRLGAGFVRTLTFLKLGLLAFVFLWGVGFQLGDWSNFTPFVARHADSAPLIGALAGGMVGAFFSFAGWWDLGKLAGEVKNPGTHFAARTHVRRDHRHDRLRSDELRLCLSCAVGPGHFGRDFCGASGRSVVRTRGWADLFAHCRRVSARKYYSGGDVGAASLLRDGARWTIHSVSRCAAQSLRNARARDCIAGGAGFSAGRRRQLQRDRFLLYIRRGRFYWTQRRRAV